MILDDIYDTPLPDDNYDIRGLFQEQFSQYYKNFNQFYAISNFISDRYRKYKEYLDQYHPKSVTYKDRLKKKYGLNKVIDNSLIKYTQATVIDLIKKRGSKQLFLQLLKENNFDLSIERLVIVNAKPLEVISEDTEKQFDPQIILNRFEIDFDLINEDELPLYTSLYVVDDNSNKKQINYLANFKSILDAMNFEDHDFLYEMCDNGLTVYDNYRLISLIECMLFGFTDDPNTLYGIPTSFPHPSSDIYKYILFNVYRSSNPSPEDLYNMAHKLYYRDYYDKTTPIDYTDNESFNTMVDTDFRSNKMMIKMMLFIKTLGLDINNIITKRPYLDDNCYRYYLEKQWDIKNPFYYAKSHSILYRKMLVYYRSITDEIMLRTDRINIYESIRKKYYEQDPIILEIANVTFETKYNVEEELKFNNSFFDVQLALNVIDALGNYVPMNVQFINNSNIEVELTQPTSTIDFNHTIGYQILPENIHVIDDEILFEDDHTVQKYMINEILFEDLIYSDTIVSNNTTIDLYNYETINTIIFTTDYVLSELDITSDELDDMIVNDLNTLKNDISALTDNIISDNILSIEHIDSDVIVTLI